MLIVIGIIALLAVYIFLTYNKFVTTKTRIKASIQEIGNQLKRQFDLIPNLVSSVKGYMKHEQKIFKDLTDARKMVAGAIESGNAQKMIDVSSKLEKALTPIRVVLESTPQLQAAGPASKLMDELRDTADKIMYSRRTLIDLSADYNIMVATIPSKFVALIFGFKEEPGLKMPETVGATEVKAEETTSPKVEL